MEIKQGTNIAVPFLMVSSANLVSAVTSLTFATSGDIQLMKAGGAFVTISQSVGVVERGFGWYYLTSSFTAHADTIGKSVIHIASSGSVPYEIVFDVVPNRAADAYNAVTSLDIAVDSLATYEQASSLSVQVSSVAAQGIAITSNVSSVQAQVNSVDIRVSSLAVYVDSMNYSLASAISQFGYQIGVGCVVNPFTTVSSNNPITVYRRTNYNPTFNISGAFSSFISSFEVYFTGKQHDTDGSNLWSVQGTVTNATSMTAVFSLTPTQTDVIPGDRYYYEVQFRDSTARVNAITGIMRLSPTLKRD